MVEVHFPKNLFCNGYRSLDIVKNVAVKIRIASVVD